jgi:hypothetical protein
MGRGGRSPVARTAVIMDPCRRRDDSVKVLKSHLHPILIGIAVWGDT